MSYNAKPLILFDNVFNLGVPTATDEATDFPVANAFDLRTYKWWKAASAGTKYITIDAGSAVSADALGIIGHNLYTATATVSVEYSSDDFSADINVALAGFVPSDDYALLKTFTAQSARYWRIKMVTASVAPYIAVAMLGERFEFPRWPRGGFDPAETSIKSRTNKSRGGHYLGAVLEPTELKTTLGFEKLTDAWCRGTFRDAWDYMSVLNPFFLAWDITNHPTEIYLAKLKDGYTRKMPYNNVRRSLSLPLEIYAE